MNNIISKKCAKAVYDALNEAVMTPEKRYEQCIQHAKKAGNWTNFFKDYTSDYHWLHKQKLLKKFYNDTNISSPKTHHNFSFNDIAQAASQHLFLKDFRETPEYDWLSNHQDKCPGWYDDIIELFYPDTGKVETDSYTNEPISVSDFNSQKERLELEDIKRLNQIKKSLESYVNFHKTLAEKHPDDYYIISPDGDDILDEETVFIQKKDILKYLKSLNLNIRRPLIKQFVNEDVYTYIEELFDNNLTWVPDDYQLIQIYPPSIFKKDYSRLNKKQKQALLNQKYIVR